MLWAMRPFIRVTMATGIACLAVSSALAAHAGSPLGYGVAAVGFRSYFVFDARAGGTVRGTLRLASLTPGAKTILVRAVDVSTAAAGGLQYGNQPPNREGRWLKLAVRGVRLSGTGSAYVPFTVRVPLGASAGDHFLGIIAVDRRALSGPTIGKGSIRLRLISRLAMTVAVRLPGRKTHALAVGGVRIDVAPSGASLALEISNTGNTLIRASKLSVTVSQGSRKLFSRVGDLAAFVPQTTITHHIPWQGTPVEGSYRVHGELRPSGAPMIVFDRVVTFGLSAIRAYRRDTGKPAIENAGTPLVMTAALALALVAAVGFGVAYGRARQQMHRPG